ncbi:hypothetical protein EPUL_001759 [Erysiphe pulchra]|uniref:Uncharacterized protein n=1 Tax=Erysiphe pulchra TaxID=225359 RepID=A0A2S4PUJ1_9PEZI|nr:hypothetical protein EPUL_001759 [Erysiphe pulchra]
MRQSIAHLAVVLCSSMAVSSAPVSPNPISPAPLTPMMAPDNEILDSNTNDQKGSVSQKRSVGGFLYHNVNQNELDKRAAGSPSNIDGPVESFSPSDSDDGFNSESESDFEDDVGAASDAEIGKRSIPDIWTRSPPPSPLEANADVSEFDDNASIASADEAMDSMSDDETSSIASADSFSPDDETSFASEFGEEDEQDPSNKQQAGAAEVAAVADGEKKDGKVEARSIDIGSQSENHGSRNYMSANSWNA